MERPGAAEHHPVAAAGVEPVRLHVRDELAPLRHRERRARDEGEAEAGAEEGELAQLRRSQDGIVRGARAREMGDRQRERHQEPEVFRGHGQAGQRSRPGVVGGSAADVGAPDEQDGHGQE